MKEQKFKIFFTMVITAIVTCSVTLLWVYGGTNSNSALSVLGSAFKSDKLETKLDIIQNKINKEYIGEVNEDDLIEGAIKGYVDGLNDKYSEYYTVDEMEEYYSDTVGEFVGIGVYIAKNKTTNEPVIVGTFKDSNAEKAGLKAGDIIIAVDGVEFNGNNYDELTDMVKGKIGTKVKIKIKRKADANASNSNEIVNSSTEDVNEEILEFEIERKNVEMIRVDSQMLDNNIGYINISSFDGIKVSNQFEEQYDKLLSEGAKSLIIDIRGNTGGIVDEAVEIADLLTNKGENLLIEENKEGKEVVSKSKQDKKITMKFVLLVDRYSASASEILAGIVKDIVDNGTIIGEKTFGKGIIQTLYELSDGSGLKITTEQYYTPNHNAINGKGIEPDIVVDDYEFEGVLELDKDTQLKKAIEILK